MLKETETEETIVFFVTFLSFVAFQLGGPGSLAPLPGYAYDTIEAEKNYANERTILVPS